MRNFGLGQLIQIPGGVNPTPIQLGWLKDITVTPKVELKKARGQYQYVTDVGRAGVDLEIKAKFMDVLASALNSIFPGVAPTTGTEQGIINEAWTIPATPWQVTVANGATFARDCGVIDLTTGKPMTRAATATGTGVYAVNVATGVYTFNTADQGHNLWISYTYTASAVGKTLSVLQAPMGASTGYEVRAYNVYGSQVLGFKFYQVHFPSLSIAMKSEDFNELDIEGFAAQDPTTQKIFDIYTGV